MKKILIVDAMNLFTRHYIAHPAMNSNGDQVGGIVGFLYELIRHIDENKPDKAIIVWESGGSSRRRSLLKEYKQGSRPKKLNRYYDEIPDTLKNRNFQIALLINILDSTRADQVYVPDCEADDVIAYLSNFHYRGNDKVIISSDKDFYQLISEETILYSPTWKKHVGVEEVVEKYGIHPNNFCLAKAIAGDKSDNISGVKGVGFKFIAKKFPELANKEDVLLQDILDKCQEEIDNKSKVQKYCKILNDKDIIKRNLKLINLDTGCLTHSQIKKVKYTLEDRDPKAHKMNVVRALLKAGINNFNVDKLFIAMRCMEE